jgi:hypothetical protein
MPAGTILRLRQINGYTVAGEEMLVKLAGLVLAFVMSLGVGWAQQSSGFVGQWQGTVAGIGEAKVIITAVRADGLVEGRMEFALQSYVSTFAEKADSLKTNRGLVSGQTLTIDAALGGTYHLTLSGDRLAGTYSRGTTFSGPASFKRL